MKIKLSAVLFFVVFFAVGFFWSRASEAASIRFAFPEGDIAVGDEFRARILVDSDQPLNAYSVTLSFPEEFLRLVRPDNSNSIIDVWQREPVVFLKGVVSFSGGSLRPFRGEGGELLSLHFKVLEAGETELRFGDSAVFLANGKGTKAIPERENATIAVSSSEGGGGMRADELDDTIPPEIAFASLVPDPFNPAQKLLSFSVRDRDSGVGETLARAREWLFWSDWEKVANPTAYPGGVWAIEFRARDHSGNISDRTLYDAGALGGRAALFLILIVLASAVMHTARKSRSAL
ncbi:hypothetical protein C4587_03000 [Candidatus Parcubacteria bacterium]|nr:MAG: hypothetical protein C4587_03000 [Candidatus Parcubacteria bacterium]